MTYARSPDQMSLTVLIRGVIAARLQVRLDVAREPPITDLHKSFPFMPTRRSSGLSLVLAAIVCWIWLQCLFAARAKESFRRREKKHTYW